MTTERYKASPSSSSHLPVSLVVCNNPKLFFLSLVGRQFVLSNLQASKSSLLFEILFLRAFVRNCLRTIDRFLFWPLRDIGGLVGSLATRSIGKRDQPCMQRSCYAVNSNGPFDILAILITLFSLKYLNCHKFCAAKVCSSVTQCSHS